ncbi:hypothetical protein SAMN05421505_1614 [Sinosporangium album]|uniref:Uncharacterized protein n=1 Tax=Sinosporangium album TaxID=504805 RepID=A0A1G8L3X0_9ACTN|nr:hypothetical protein [Sinosporangium album]SDI50403.1 hypothetical protein SAMN05421505_1614 [Sinosporangium album]
MTGRPRLIGGTTWIIVSDPQARDDAHDAAELTALRRAYGHTWSIWRSRAGGAPAHWYASRRRALTPAARMLGFHPTLAAHSADRLRVLLERQPPPTDLPMQHAP